MADGNIPERLDLSLVGLDPVANLLEQATDGIFFWNPSSDEVLWSAKTFSSLGYDVGNSGSYGSIRSLIHPEDLDDHDQTLFDAQKNRKPFSQKVRLLREDGNYATIISNGHWFKLNDIASYLLGYINDVSEKEILTNQLKQKNNILDCFFHNAPAAAFIKDRNLVHLFGNELAAEYAGSTLEEFIGASVYDLFDEITAQQLAETDKQVLHKKDKVIWKGTVFINGESRELYDTKFPIIDPITGETFLGGFGVDISKQREVEKALERSQRLESLGQLVAGVAHDFNNLLAVIVSNVELLNDSAMPGSAMELVAQIDEATKAGHRLTQQLLTFGQRADHRREVIGLNQAIAKTTAMLQRVLKVNVRVNVAPQADPDLVILDEGQLNNAILNLALNAQYAMEDEGELSISSGNQTIEQTDDLAQKLGLAPGSYVFLKVSDTGSGMNEDVLARVFEPFYTTKPSTVGTGLGLAVIYGFVTDLGGAIDVQSEPGHGSTFTLYFPATNEPEKRHSPEKNALFFGDAHVLLVEDLSPVRLAIARQLRALGYRVSVAENAMEAIDRFNDESINLVLTDLVMPGAMQGPELAKRVRTQRPEIPIIFMSGYPMETAISKEGLPPNEVLLMKPIRRAALSQALHEALHGK